MSDGGVEILGRKTLSESWGRLSEYEFRRSADKEPQTREVFERGDAAVALLRNREAGTLLLTRQFRLPTYVNGNADGMLLEACAGLLDGMSPEDCIRKEIEEELGYRVARVTKLFAAYSSPGALTERVHYFVADYSPEDRVGEGGGLAEEGEEVEVVELPIAEALAMLDRGEIRDAKTLVLLLWLRGEGE